MISLLIVKGNSTFNEFIFSLNNVVTYWLENKNTNDTISNIILPCLHTAKTYVEVKMFESPEIKINLSKAAIETSYLTDKNPKYAPLYSRIRVLLEEFSQIWSIK